MKFVNEFIGMSVKEILTDKLGFSKRAITELKTRPDGILINGAHVTVRAVVREGDVLEINASDVSSNEEKLVPSNVLPEIIYEDEYIIALNKPPFMPTHQSQGHFYDTLANSLANYYTQKNRPFVFRSINRLDRNTSGIVLVAKDRISAAKLSEQMKAGNIRKEYIAILDGIPAESEGTIETYIRRKEKSIILREVCDRQDDAQIAITKYSLKGVFGSLSLVEARPLTGRTHQLRVHFAHIGTQILGDDLYGKASPLISRHALHASKLSFIHPHTREQMLLIAPLPLDMMQLIEKEDALCPVAEKNPKQKGN